MHFISIFGDYLTKIQNLAVRYRSIKMNLYSLIRDNAEDVWEDIKDTAEDVEDFIDDLRDNFVLFYYRKGRRCLGRYKGYSRRCRRLY